MNYKEKLLDRGINPASEITYDINSKQYAVTLEWICNNYAKSEKATLFNELFEKALKQSNADIQTFFEQMGQLLLMSSLSNKFGA